MKTVPSAVAVTLFAVSMVACADHASPLQPDLQSAASFSKHGGASLNSGSNKGKDAKEVEVRGVLKAVAADGTSITITTKTGDVVVPVDSTTKIERNEKNALLTDLKVGDTVEAESLAGALAAKEIEAKGV